MAEAFGPARGHYLKPFLQLFLESDVLDIGVGERVDVSDQLVGDIALEELLDQLIRLLHIGGDDLHVAHQVVFDGGGGQPEDELERRLQLELDFLVLFLIAGNVLQLDVLF